MPRQFIRSLWGSQTNTEEVARALREALDADGTVEIHDEQGDASALVFTLRVHPRGPAVIAATPDGRHLATCVGPQVAIRDAFRLLDNAVAAAARSIRTPRRQRSRRGEPRP